MKVFALVARLGLAALLLSSGYLQITGVDAPVGEFIPRHLLQPHLLLGVAAVLEVIVGLALLSGIGTRLASSLAALFNVATAFLSPGTLGDQKPLIELSERRAPAIPDCCRTGAS